MSAREDEHGWSRGQRALHWATAVLVLAGFVLAWVMVAVPFRPLLLKFTLYQAHKTIGLLVIALTIWRLGLRAIRGRAGWPAGLSATQRRLAALGHAVIYAFLLGVPVLGYFTAAAAPIQIPTFLFGVISVPHAIAPDRAAFAMLRPIHMWAAIALIVLAAGHAAMAIRHHRAGSTLLRRMWRG
jgi:cytochrome b561